MYRSFGSELGEVKALKMPRILQIWDMNSDFSYSQSQACKCMLAAYF